MADIDLKTETPDTTLPTTGFLFGADSQAASAPSVYSTQTVATTLLGSTSLTGATITADAPVLNLSQTWNASGVTFTGMRFNAAGSSGTNSANASLLMDLQVGGASRFSVSKDGQVNLGGAIFAKQTATNYVEASTGWSVGAAGGSGVLLRLAIIAAGAAAQIGFTSAGPVNPLDTILTRRGPANLRLGAADAASPVAQTLSVQSVVAGTSNTAGANLTITGSQGTGTGAGGSIIFQVAPAGSTSNSVQNALADALTINGDQTVQFASTIALGGSSGATLFKQNASNYIEAGTGFSMQAGNSMGVAMMNGLFNVGPQAYYGWNGTNAVSTADVRLYRDAANTLALRNGANAQAFRVYNTTDGTNSEYASLTYVSNVARWQSEKSGTGTVRNMEIIRGTTSHWTFNSAGNTFGAHLLAGTDNTYDIGASGATRPRDLFLGRNLVQVGAYHEMAEMTAPSAPAADGVRIYAVDNGSGKTQLMALFATGAAQQIAIEP